MSSPLKRSADEILEALEAAAHQIKRALRDRQRDQADRIRDQNRAVRDTDDGMGTETPDVGRYTRGPVHELDIGPFRNLRRRAVRGDRMQHDHIPSVAAMVRAERDRLGGRRLTRAERRAIVNDGLCIELRDSLHAVSRTFKGRNTRSQVNLDASDLLAAAQRDIDVLRTNLINLGEYDIDTIDAVTDRLEELARLRWGRG